MFTRTFLKSLTFLSAGFFFICFSTFASDFSDLDVTDTIHNTSDHNNTTLIFQEGTPLSSSSHIGAYVYMSGTIDGNISIANSRSVTSTHSNYGVIYFPYIGNTSSLKNVDIINDSALISTGGSAKTIYMIGKADGAVGRSFDFTLTNNGNINSAADAVKINNGSTGSFTINNSGEIASSNSGDATVLYLSGGANTEVNNSGNITANSASEDAMYLDSAVTTVTNSGSGSITGKIIAAGGVATSYSITNNSSGGITGDITTTNANLDIVNTSGTITGNIVLGDHASSSLTLNGGSVVGNVTMNNSAQNLTFNNGSLTGTINGAGNINVDFDTVTNGNIGASTSLTAINISALRTLDAATNDNSIRATNISLASGSVLSVADAALDANVDAVTAGQGTVNITRSTNSNLTTNLGANRKLEEVNITAVSAAAITAQTTIHADEVTISGIDGALFLASSIGIDGDVTIGANSNLLLSDGSFVEGAIKAAVTGSGAFDLASNMDYTARGNIGTSSLKLHNIGVADGSTLTTTYGLWASSISIGSNATLNASSYVTGALDFSTNGTLNLQDGSFFRGSINSGGMVGEGIINSSGLAIILAPIGDTGEIEEINVASGSQLRIGNSDDSHANTIEAGNINITGQLDLLDATAISGDVTMLGSSSKLNFSGYSHTISGDFTTASGSRLYSTIHSASSLDKLTVSGALTLNSNTKLSLTRSAVTLGSSYTLLEGGSGSSLSAITASNIDVDGSGTNRSGRYIFTTEISGDNLLLKITLASLNTNNGNQSSIYNNILDANTGSSGALYAMQNYLTGSASDEAKNIALNSVMPQVDNSSNRIIFNAANTSLDLTSARLANLYNARDIGGMQTSADLRPKNPLNRFDVNPNNLLNVNPDYRNSIWSQIFGSNISQGNNSLSEGYNANIRGVALGFDRKIDKNLYLGISGSYADSSAKSRSELKKTNIDSYQINLYSGHYFANYFINNMVGFVWNEYKSSRAIPATGNVALAQYSGQNYIARSEGGKNFKLPQNFVITPSVAITAAHNVVDDYSENNAGTLNLNVRTTSSNFFETRAGIALKNSFQLKNITIDPTIFVSYGYDFASAKQKTNNNFIGQTSTFDSTSTNLARGSFKSGIGARIYKTSALAFDLNYTYEKRVNYRANSVGIKAVWWF